MEYAVETFSLTKVFSDFWGRSRVYAVDDLNLKIQYNEVFGLLGPNGSGKTTTLKVLLGLLYPTKGRSLCLGGDATNPAISARIGFLPEESYLYKYLSARETLDFYGRLFGLPAKVRKMRIEELLDMVGLIAVANRPVGTFSKGMARRIGLAQALINDPDLLILDEPTTGLDPIGTRQIKDLILELSKRGKTVLICSHLLADVEDMCDRIAILYGGKIQAKGRVDSLLQQTHKKQIITDAISDSAVEKIKQIVQAEDADCVVTAPMHKLESFFIETVAAAERLERPTSGAVSTTKIGEFLMEEAVSENILDKLVSGQASKGTAAESPETEEPVPDQSPEPEPDEQLLSKLAEPAQPETLAPDEKAATEPVETQVPEQQQAEKSILDELTEPPTPHTKEPGQTDKPQAGDLGDA